MPYTDKERQKEAMRKISKRYRERRKKKVKFFEEYTTGDWGRYKLNDDVHLITKARTALEKLKAIPIGKRIKISGCDDVEVKSVIWRTGENEYKIDRKQSLEIEGIREMIWQQNQWEEEEEEKPMPDDFDPICYYWETLEGLTAKQVLELEAFSTNVNNLQMVHDIELHELYEIPTKSKGFTKEQWQKHGEIDWSSCKVVS